MIINKKAFPFISGRLTGISTGLLELVITRSIAGFLAAIINNKIFLIEHSDLT